MSTKAWKMWSLVMILGLKATRKIEENFSREWEVRTLKKKWCVIDCTFSQQIVSKVMRTWNYTQLSSFLSTKIVLHIQLFKLKWTLLVTRKTLHRKSSPVLESCVGGGANKSLLFDANAVVCLFEKHELSNLVCGCDVFVCGKSKKTCQTNDTV